MEYPRFSPVATRVAFPTLTAEIEVLGHHYNRNSNALPFFVSHVAAGFPSPADDYLEMPLDLNDYLIKHPAATFFVRVSGDSMLGAGIHHNDILIVDRSVEPTSGMVVVAIVDGDFTVKRLVHQKGKKFLQPENSAYSSIELTSENNVEIWGVVQHVIHSLTTQL